MLKNYSYDILVAVSIILMVSIQFLDPLYRATNQTLKKESHEMKVILNQLKDKDLNELGKHSIQYYMETLNDQYNHYIFTYYRLCEHYPKAADNERIDHMNFDIDIRYKTVQNQLQYLLMWKK